MISLSGFVRKSGYQSRKRRRGAKKSNSLESVKHYLWHESSKFDLSLFRSKDRKRMLRLLIKDLTVEKRRTERKAILHIRWGGAIEAAHFQIGIDVVHYWIQRGKIPTRRLD